jgi:hypothetical protein
MVSSTKDLTDFLPLTKGDDGMLVSKCSVTPADVMAAALVSGSRMYELMKEYHVANYLEIARLIVADKTVRAIAENNLIHTCNTSLCYAGPGVIHRDGSIDLFSNTWCSDSPEKQTAIIENNLYKVHTYKVHGPQDDDEIAVWMYPGYDSVVVKFERTLGYERYNLQCGGVAVYGAGEGKGAFHKSAYQLFGKVLLLKNSDYPQNEAEPRMLVSSFSGDNEKGAPALPKDGTVINPAANYWNAPLPSIKLRNTKNETKEATPDLLRDDRDYSLDDEHKDEAFPVLTPTIDLVMKALWIGDPVKKPGPKKR